MTARILCIGNRHVQSDDFGPRVHDALATLPLPEAVQLMEGGTRGLDLLPFLEGACRVVFVDAVEGFGKPGEIVRLTGEEVACATTGGFDHAAGLPYLLSVLPRVLDSQPPTITVIGFEGIAEEGVIHEAAQLALFIATERA